jgi:hypothetical protein
MAKRNFVVESTNNMTSNLAGVTNPILPPTPSVSQTIERQAKGKNKGLKADEDRQSFVIRAGQYEKLQAMAYWDRVTVKELIISILDDSFAAYEKQKGELKPIPKRNK